MINQKLIFARAYEQALCPSIPRESRPVFHLTPWIGWMNDPNGFSYYHGQYHLFYQYNPYDTEWDSMHWGHAVSHDLLHWTYLPCAMAPDESYDSFGVFSGSAIEMKDGRQLLMYTGVRKEGNEKNSKDVQVQCLAVGDGLDYQKLDINPVLDASCLPVGKSVHDFRDPKIWREDDGTYRCIIATCDKDRMGCILLFSSEDGLSWKSEGILAENDGRLGRMWECPDLFKLDGKTVLFVSPQDMSPEGFEYHNGNGTVCLIGHMDAESKKFIPEHDQAIDYGIDFYAPQTILTPDGRRVMIGWMQNWDTCKLTGYEERKWFGQMSLPRELSIRDGRLYQQPIRELALYRSRMVEYKDVQVSDEMTLEGIEGRKLELDIHVRPADPENPYRKFIFRFAKNEKYHSILSFRPYESLLKIDRKFSGSRRAYIHQRRAEVQQKDSEIHLHVILDRFSIEVFINDGEQVMTATILTDTDAQGISFEADGQAVMDITKYSLFAEE